MAINSEAGLDGKFIAFAQLMNNYLAHFPSHEKFGLALDIRRAAYDTYALIVECQKRYQKKRYARLRCRSTYANGSPLSLMPAYIRQWCMPNFLASCVAVSRSPRYSIQTCLRRLFCCIKASAHRQFSGVYGPNGSTLSSVVPSGLSLAHKTNPAKVRHSSHTNTPLSPYARYCLSFSLWHRLTMPRHPAYKCLLFENTQSLNRSAAIFFIAGDLAQPQEAVSPLCKVYEAANFSPPHSQEQSHIAPFLLLPSRRNAVSLPNFFPVKSIIVRDIFTLSK